MDGQTCLKRANCPKGWGAKPLAYVSRRRDRVAGLPGKPNTPGTGTPGPGAAFGAPLARTPVAFRQSLFRADRLRPRIIAQGKVVERFTSGGES